MEHSTPKSTTSPRDFFLWAGAIIALYGSTISLITLLFSYIERAFPDPLSYVGDPYDAGVRAAMAGVIVLVPTTVILLRFIRKTIDAEPGKASIWPRRWGLVLTIFIAIAIIVIDLITLLTTFLGGELTVRFLLKVAVVLLVASGIALHFLADLRGYWVANGKKAAMVGAATILLSLAAVGAGFFVIGTPSDARAVRYDNERVQGLSSIQYSVLDYYQRTGALPETLDVLTDPLSGYTTPVDPRTEEPYTYRVTGPLTFTLCATFERESEEQQREYMTRPMDFSDSWTHGVGETCFDRTIDPARYPLYERAR